MIAQVVIFKLNSPEVRREFLELTERMAAWLQQQPGFISYDLIEGDGVWSDRLVWQSGDDEKRGRAAFFNTEIARKILLCVDGDFRSVTGALSTFNQQV